MKKLLLVVFGVIISTILFSPVCRSAEVPTTTTVKRIAAVRVKTPPVIDGRLNDACWKEAAPADGFSVFTNPNVMHPEQTIGRVCYDDNNLYISMECVVKEMDKFKNRMVQAKGKFEYDKGGVIEVFLDTNHDKKTFQQYLLHANGSSMITLPPGDLFKILNEEYLKSAASVTETGFNIEMAFPLAMLHLHPDTSRVWGFNLNRAHDLYDERFDTNGFYSSWNSTKGLGFQNAELFGELLVDEDFSRFYWNVDFVRVPQAGDSSVQLTIKNETGGNFRGKVVLSVVQDEGKTLKYEKPVSLKKGVEQIFSFRHSVSSKDVEARYKVVLTDSAGKVCYLGGTQTEDLTPGDNWAAPVPTKSQQKTGYITFARPYTQPALYRSIPRREEIITSLSLKLCPGEFEPITFSLYPLRNMEKLTVSVSDLVGPQGAIIPSSAIDVRQVTYQSDWKNPRSFEAKEHLLRHFDALNLIKGRSQRLWLTIKAGDKTPAGIYSGRIALTSGKTVSVIPLAVQVLPFELSAPDDMGYFMYYPGVAFKPVCNPDFFQKIVKDMRDHGMTTFTIYNWVKVAGGPNGKSYLDLDNRVADNLGVTYARMMEILQKEGMGKNVPLMDVFSMHYEAELIVQLDKICRERKWPEVLFYINDEIEYPERIAAARKVLEAIRAINPEIKTTTAMGPKGAEALGSMYDVWIGCSTPEMVEKCLSLGKSPWTYNCRETVEVSPAFERSFFGRYAWKMGLKGVGLWSYTENKTFFDRFGRLYGYGEFTFTPEFKQQYGHVYFEKGEIIPSVTWEAVREGIDDYRYLLTLKKVAQAALTGNNAGKRAAGEDGIKLLQTMTDQINPEYNSEDKKYGRNWPIFGDMDSERTRVIEAILNITEKK